jgi:drug/metabolite transporter (DMT)-like permease
MILPLAGILFALASAAAWGFADFFGGIASRRSSHVEVLALSRLSLVGVLTTLAVVTKDPLPPAPSVAWAIASGLCGASGIASLYKGLSVGRSSFVVPTAGVVGAALPVLFGAISEGMLPVIQQVGLVVALAGIWLVSKGHGDEGASSPSGIKYGFLAGMGFGGSFILLGQVQQGFVFTPLAIGGCAGVLVAVAALTMSRTRLPVPTRNPGALMAGTLDAIGIACYMLAINLIRLDIAVILGSVYPAIAVLLFWQLKKERVAATQWLGLAVCITAIALIVV